MNYRMTTTRGTIYVLAENGAVLSRSNGPKGWDYSGKWVILGATTRFNARAIIGLSEIAENGIPGQGWIHDLDHGTHRSWGSERMRSLQIIEREQGK
jgi:hypothetical protein